MLLPSFEFGSTTQQYTRRAARPVLNCGTLQETVGELVDKPVDSLLPVSVR